jgi:NAD(P)-dependent dehydrogenase (short-subunit alcohol dehydrogenase family)
MVGTYLKRLGFFNELNATAWIAGVAYLIYSGGVLVLLKAFAVALAVALLYRFAVRSGSNRVKPFSNAAILITGTSTGIGATSAVNFATQGFTVFATVRKAADGEKTKAAAPAAVRDRIVPVVLDVNDADSVNAAAKTVGAEIEKRGLALQSVINNAGFTVNGVLEYVTREQMLSQFNTNVFGVLSVTNAFLPLLRAARGRTSAPPSVVFISSVGGKITVPVSGLYTATKHALESLAEAYKIELAPQGISSVLVEPGATESAFTAHLFSSAEASMGDIAVDADTRAQYRSFTDGFTAAVEQTFFFPAEYVADTLAEAVTSSEPHVRYRATPDAHVGLALLALLPDSFYLTIMALAAKAQLKKKRNA